MRWPWRRRPRVDLDVPEVIPQGLPQTCVMRLPGMSGHLVPMVPVGVDGADGQYVMEALVPEALKDEIRETGASVGMLLVIVPVLPCGVKVKMV